MSVRRAGVGAAKIYGPSGSTSEESSFSKASLNACFAYVALYLMTLPSQQFCLCDTLFNVHDTLMKHALRLA